MTTMIPATDTTDDELAIARRIVAGDRTAFEAMMRRHNRRLYRLARATLRNEAEAGRAAGCVLARVPVDEPVSR